MEIEMLNMWRDIQILPLRILIFWILSLSAPAWADTVANTSPTPKGMVWIPGGKFTMGSQDESSRKNEGPPHSVEVDGFWLDQTTVTNEDFQKFVKATGYITTAERKPTWEEIKKQLPPDAAKPDDSLLVPGSMVFTPSSGPVDLRDMSNFWRWVPGTSWNRANASL